MDKSTSVPCYECGSTGSWPCCLCPTTLCQACGMISAADGVACDHAATMNNPEDCKVARRLAAATINAVAMAGGAWLLLAVFAAGFKFY